MGGGGARSCSWCSESRGGWSRRCRFASVGAAVNAAGLAVGQPLRPLPLQAETAAMGWPQQIVVVAVAPAGSMPMMVSAALVAEPQTHGPQCRTRILLVVARCRRLCLRRLACRARRRSRPAFQVPIVVRLGRQLVATRLPVRRGRNRGRKWVRSGLSPTNRPTRWATPWSLSAYCRARRGRKRLAAARSSTRASAATCT